MYDEHDAAYDDFIDGLYREFRASALDDVELYDKVVDAFRASRLWEVYLASPEIAQPALGALAEAKQLLGPHPRAALLLAVTATEVCLRTLLFRPVLQAAFHSDAAADVFAPYIATTKDDRLIKALVVIVAKESGVDLHTYQRPGMSKALWQEIHELQGCRNRALHQAAAISPANSEHAIAVADVLLSEVFPKVISAVGLHLHDDARICGSGKCGVAGGVT